MKPAARSLLVLALICALGGLPWSDGYAPALLWCAAALVGLAACAQWPQHIPAAIAAGGACWVLWVLVIEAASLAAMGGK